MASKDDFGITTISALATKILANLDNDDTPLELKMAALRVAASTIEGAIGARVVAAAIYNSLNRK